MSDTLGHAGSDEMLVFAGRDPGAKNIILPIHRHANQVGVASEFVDLMADTALLEANDAYNFLASRNPQGLVCGFSGFEWPLIRASNALGIPSIIVVDIGIGDQLDRVSREDYPDLFLVANQGCVEELVGREVDRREVIMNGSPYLEHLASSQALHSGGPDLLAHYGLPKDSFIVPFFTTTHTDHAASALDSLVGHLAETALPHPCIIVRPHPLARDLETLVAACAGLEAVRLDLGGEVPTPQLLSSSRISLSMASTTSLESMALGVPSAFYQIGWPFHATEAAYENVTEVRRIRDSSGLRDFVDEALNRPEGILEGVMNDHEGALGRAWEAISRLVNPA